jgi:uncharacterized protein (UPF0276 family)
VIETDGNQRPFLGYGLGLRRQHYDDILDSRPDVDWFEVISENYMVDGGKPLYYLSRIRELYPIVMHGVSLSIGSTEPLNYSYLKQLKNLIQYVEPVWFSDHLCWTGIDKLNMHDLLPLPYTEEAIDHIVDRVARVQDYLGRQMLLENVSSYISYSESQLSEWEFLREVAQRADCLILLDINNIYVSAFNHNFDPSVYLRAMPAERIYQIHLAGHTREKGIIIDTHDHPIADPVYDLYSEAIERFGRVSTMIERDDHIPPLADLLQELARVRRIGETSLVNQVA